MEGGGEGEERVSWELLEDEQGGGDGEGEGDEGEGAGDVIFMKLLKK